MERASAHLYREQPDQAIPLLEGLRQRGDRYADAPEPLLLLAQAHHQAGLINRTLQLYAEGVERHPEDARFAEAYGQLCLDEAQRLFREGKGAWYANDDEALFREARALLSRVEDLRVSPELGEALTGLAKRIDREL